MTDATAAIDSRPPNVAAMFLERVAASPNGEAFRYPVDDTWESVTWGEANERIQQLAAGLLELGVQSEDRVGIASGTRYEWILADMAIMCAGAATTTVYQSTVGPDVAYILADSESVVVFAEDDEQLKKLREYRDEIPLVRHVVLLEGDDDDEWVLSLDELAAKGKARLDKAPKEIEEIAAQVPPEGLATLIYTSGTTGRPKGVRLTHSSWTYEAAAINSTGILTADDLQFLWLPLAHSFGKVLLTVQLSAGFPTAVDGRVDKIIDNLAVVKPTFMGAAPRIFEKAYSRIHTMQENESALKQKIFKQAFAVGLEVDRRKLAGESIPLSLKLQHGLFDKLVFAKVRARFGGRVRFFISGSAALNSTIAQWFHAAGVLILEGYGLTESSAGSFVNRPDHYKIGTVGPVVPGSEVKIGEEGEVLLRGPFVMDGYHNLPDDSAKTLTDDGWLRTGDKGSLDDEGFLTITGRIKELFKTSGGKYVAPPAIEAAFKSLCPYASQFVVFGDERNFCVALITLDEEAIAVWAASNGVTGGYPEIVNDPKTVEMVTGYVDQLNAGLNRWETIKKWRLLDHDLSIDSGELTPSLKVKRAVVEKNNSELIDSFYS